MRELALTCAVATSTLACRGEPSVAQASPSEVPPRTASGERMVQIDPTLLEQGRIVLTASQLRPVSDELLVTGQVIAPPHGKAEIGALLPSRIREINVEEGQLVKKGQVLAILVAPDAARISGELAAARARRTHAEIVLAQEKRLAEQSATSERAVTEATSDAATARADERAASVMLGTYDVSGAQLTLRSPLSGVVAASNAMLGAQVDSDTILFRVIDTNQLVVRADVPESMANEIRLGTPVQVRLPTQSASCSATIVSSTRSVDPIKRTVSFRIKPSERCPTMLEGGFADVQIPLQFPSYTKDGRVPPAAAGKADALGDVELPSSGSAAPSTPASPPRKTVAVPRSAVVELDGVPIAFVATDRAGQFRVAPLTVAKHTETTTWVEQGLVGGERIASRGALLLKGELMKSRLE